MALMPPTPPFQPHPEHDMLLPLPQRLAQSCHTLVPTLMKTDGQ